MRASRSRIVRLHNWAISRGAYYFHFDGIKIALTCGFIAVLDESLRWLLNGASMKWFRLSAMLLTLFMTCGTAFAHGAGTHLPHFRKSKQRKSYGSKNHKTTNPHHRVTHPSKAHSHSRSSSHSRI